MIATDVAPADLTTEQIDALLVITNDPVNPERVLAAGQLNDACFAGHPESDRIWAALP